MLHLLTRYELVETVKSTLRKIEDGKKEGEVKVLYYLALMDYIISW